MKRILLPTDFSKNAWNALKYTSELYKNETVDFYLLNGFMVQNYSTETMMVSQIVETYFEEARNRSEENLQKLLKQIELLDVPSNHTYFTHSTLNTPLHAVLSLIEEKDIDLVVVSNKGETDALTVFMGSNTITFMEKVRNCPVLMVPTETLFSEPNEIVFPTSFKTHYKRKELSHLYEISRITNAPIRILHINQGEELSEAQKERKALLAMCFDGLTYSYHFLENKNVQTGLSIFTQSRNSGMIAFINKKHLFVNSIFSKPLVKELGYHAKVPVLVLHDLRN